MQNLILGVLNLIKLKNFIIRLYKANINHLLNTKAIGLIKQHCLLILNMFCTNASLFVFFSFILTITPLYVQIIQIHGNDVHRPLLRIYNRNYNFLIKIFLRPFIRFRHRTEYGNKISSLMNIEPEKI